MTGKTISGVVVVLFLFADIFAALGIYEAIRLADVSRQCDGDCTTMTQVYALVITNCILNLLAAMSLVGAAAYLHLTGNTATIGRKTTPVWLGVAIWDVVVYFLYRHDVPQYEEILFIQMVFFFTLIGLGVMILFLTSCAVCFCRRDSNLMAYHRTDENGSVSV